MNGMNDTPVANRIHIGFFGRRNAGKSSVVNAVTNQELSIVSDTQGTTTDPVKKSMEILPIGPVLIIDTPGFDDEGELGELRVKKTKQILNRTDIAVLVVDATCDMSDTDKKLLEIFKEKNIKYLIAYNKCDLLDIKQLKRLSEEKNSVLISAKDRKNIDQLKEKLALFVEKSPARQLVGDIVNKGDTCILVVPIDGSAPKGRLILPQQQVIRELLENGVVTMVVQPSELTLAIEKLNEKPALVITDSQAFEEVSALVPQDIRLTSFSILMARYKGFLKEAAAGAISIDLLQDNDCILISEGCTHHRQCEDIGTVKLPNMLKSYTKKKLNFEFSSGDCFPEDLSGYSLIIHCGGCMLNEREVNYRMKCAVDQGIPFTNYGTAIALTKGILMRSLEVFEEIKNN